MTAYLVPALLLAVSALALGRGADVYDALLEGGRRGLELVKTILPAMVMLLTAVELLRATPPSCPPCSWPPWLCSPPCWASPPSP